MTLPEQSRSGSCAAARWRLPLLLAIVLVAMVMAGSQFWRQGWPPRPQPVTETGIAAQQVLLTINFGDGTMTNHTVAWREGMTVADVLQQERSVSIKGDGAGAARFLTEINGIANQGAVGRNWTYSVNGKFADRSFAVYELRPNDHVLWTFTDQQ